ncbi:tetratricopeptide repeat protein [Luteimonas sp. SX5]|uniref:Tetratricopeptide repeat protein n=1 Tax=Luteimonas galliterrae TaxID=2940486 RepID=A0ABT0MES7_9GAMM|nr:tetratricopeptide repeat protein [Luteimonas galliterrae]
MPEFLPQGRYIDEDAAASHMKAPPGGRAQMRQAINAAIQKNPRNATALAHRAYFFLESGDLARAKRDFDAAMAAAEPGSGFERNVLWSRGWAEYDLGDYAAALADWQRTVALHGGKPFWAAYSFALLYWTAGQQDTALAWYDAAVLSNPQWGNENGFIARTKYWAPPQRGQMRALFDAWKGTSRKGSQAS